jgi:hypothetical protein
MDDEQAKGGSSASHGIAIGANIDREQASIDCGSTLHVDHTPKLSQPISISEKQLRFRLARLEMKRAETQKLCDALLSDYDKEIAILHGYLHPALDRGDSSRPDEPEGGAVRVHSSNLSILSDADDNMEMKCEPNLSPGTSIATCDQDFSSAKKRKRFCGVWGLRQPAPKPSDDFDDDATMTDAIDILPASSFVGGTSHASMPPLRKRLSQAIPTYFAHLTGKPRRTSKVATGADVIPEVSPTHHKSQRPSSWPSSRGWRKSLGISVKALRDNFEKLALEASESVSSHPRKSVHIA